MDIISLNKTVQVGFHFHGNVIEVNYMYVRKCMQCLSTNFLIIKTLK
jgi:hypothetical protein